MKKRLLSRIIVFALLVGSFAAIKVVAQDAENAAPQGDSTATVADPAAEESVSETPAEEPAAPALVGDAARGKDLFVGNISFTNGGPTCNSCHNVNMAGVITGGALALDLTQAHSRLDRAGIEGVISGLPYPQMRQSYEPRPVTEQEIADIAAFLEEADKQAAANSTASIGGVMLGGGIVGAVVLLILISLFWIKRKKRAVNYSIYKRQIKST
ncbi:MAG: c-type cytochrome [Bacteroidetes bacterium]|nr:c-type cytochrome [Bacteroidota bacterium]MCZ2133341.1 c-type cytochrome [Bacteroidota bacterium]